GSCWGLSWRCATRSPTPTPARSSTGTSSRRTSCWATTARSSSWTGAWPRSGARRGAVRAPRRARWGPGGGAGTQEGGGGGGGREEARVQRVRGQVLGTPAYMAPEQAEGRLERVGEWSDIYGLGAVLYELLTGGPPLAGGNTDELLRRVVHESPLPPRQRVPS